MILIRAISRGAVTSRPADKRFALVRKRHAHRTHRAALSCLAPFPQSILITARAHCFSAPSDLDLTRTVKPVGGGKKNNKGVTGEEAVREGMRG
jgi:hypothetical protein